MKSHPISILVFASEQVLPTLQFLTHAANTWSSQIAAVHVYCTHDERRSVEPAKRLARVFDDWTSRRGVRVPLKLVHGGMWPLDVRAGLMACFEPHPSHRWIVNVTGGTKPMSAAAIELTLSTDLSNVMVVYQEINGQWVELCASADNNLLQARPLSAHDDVVPSMAVVDKMLNPGDVVLAQFSGEHEIAANAVKPLPVDQALMSVMAHNWQWRDGLLAVPDAIECINNGDAFERFIGAGLLACGIPVQHSLKVLDRADMQRVVREVDLVCYHAGRLACIDIKLPGAEQHAKGTQLADIAELAHSLGGRAAVPIALRPGWRADAEVLRLAQALGVRLLTQAEAPAVFTQLMAIIDATLPIPPEVRHAETVLQQRCARGESVLSNGDKLNVTVHDNGCVALDKLLRDSAGQRQTCWSVVHISGAQYWLWLDKKSVFVMPAVDWQHVLQRLQRGFQHLGCHPDAIGIQSRPNSIFGMVTVANGVKAVDVVLCVKQSLLS